jgi:uncharacterized protein YndB with AHSA1/START domain
MPRPRIVSAERTIHATPEVIFGVLADPSRHAEIDGSGSVQGPKGTTPRLSLGATFSMDMKMGLGYRTSNRVVEFEEGRRIAWHHLARFTWRYELTPVDGGTRVVESFDYTVPWGVVIEPLGWPERNRRSMERTLERLEAVVTAGAPPAS